MNVKNEIKSIIVRSGMTMQQVVDSLRGAPPQRESQGGLRYEIRRYEIMISAD